jgi:hypothetical protein
MELLHVQDLDGQRSDRLPAHRSTRAVYRLVIPAVELLHVEDLPARR